MGDCEEKTLSKNISRSIAQVDFLKLVGKNIEAEQSFNQTTAYKALWKYLLLSEDPSHITTITTALPPYPTQMIRLA